MVKAFSHWLSTPPILGGRIWMPKCHTLRMRKRVGHHTCRERTVKKTGKAKVRTICSHVSISPFWKVFKAMYISPFVLPMKFGSGNPFCSRSPLKTYSAMLCCDRITGIYSQLPAFNTYSHAQFITNTIASSQHPGALMLDCMHGIQALSRQCKQLCSISFHCWGWECWDH